MLDVFCIIFDDGGFGVQNNKVVCQCSLDVLDLLDHQSFELLFVRVQLILEIACQFCSNLAAVDVKCSFSNVFNFGLDVSIPLVKHLDFVFDLLK